MEGEVVSVLESEEETLAWACALGEALVGPAVIALIGEMGSGKTAFVRGLARGLGVVDLVNSPTYTLMQRYEGRLRLDHYDAWMEGREREVLADGAHELLGVEGVSVVEWGDRVEAWLPQDRLEVRLVVLAEQRRELRARWLGGSDGGPTQRALEGLDGWVAARSKERG